MNKIIIVKKAQTDFNVPRSCPWVIEVLPEGPRQ
jgi:hypothetical protein